MSFASSSLTLRNKSYKDEHSFASLVSFADSPLTLRNKSHRKERPFMSFAGHLRNKSYKNKHSFVDSPLALRNVNIKIVV